MQQVKHIFKKEFGSYFVSPIAYIVIAIFLLVTGWFFFTTFFLYNQANLRGFFNLLPIIFSFVIPAVTMRLFSEELNVGSYETLLTMPVTFNDVILGKFFGSVAFIAAMLAPTLSYPIFISFLGNLDWGPVIGGYLGAILLGAAFSAIGLFASSLTRNQIIAFIIGMAICFILTLIDKMLFFLPKNLLGFFGYLGADFHFRNISKGIIDSRDILYFLSLSFISVYGTHLVMKRKY
ncbi:MAG: ABC transporter permease subunit [Desulfobacterales bacterium]|jgi:ABC-2 type transport system permease protein|nr:ABC transporter permease subunit [Desulfobacteraceae bacterium]MBT4363740.1 ABC transporter permease subunit [Desulfobacteraceae bacterium]MBT7086794.1 ABC transporter permease subunit [Desulfobacterales bacterium]MBT7697903.1 ABC transporter permease subunit [Desulfobacterales bacterium]